MSPPTIISSDDDDNVSAYTSVDDDSDSDEQEEVPESPRQRIAQCRKRVRELQETVLAMTQLHEEERELGVRAIKRFLSQLQTSS